MKKYIFSGIVTLLLVGTVAVPHITQAETSTNTQMLEQIKALMAKVEELQKQLAVLRGEVKSVLKDGLSEGMTDADIAKLQELLATDPTIYPEGKKTGYFGPLTKEAIKRFQARHGLEITGKVDEETKDMLEEYLHEGFGGTIPVGLLKAPGIAKKVEDRFLLGCDKRHGGGKGMGPLCKKWKEEHGKNTDDDSDDENDDENDDDSDEQEDAFHVEVEVEDGDAVVSFKFEGRRYEVDVDGTNIDDVLEEVADELDVDVADVDEDLADAIESELEDAIDENDEEDFDVEIEIEDDETTVSFEFDDDDYEFTIDSTDEDTILEKVANELDIDVEDIDEDLEDAIKDALADAKDAE